MINIFKKLKKKKVCEHCKGSGSAYGWAGTILLTPLILFFLFPDIFIIFPFLLGPMLIFFAKADPFVFYIIFFSVILVVSVTYYTMCKGCRGRGKVA